MKRNLVLAVLVLALILLAGCAPGPNDLVETPDAEGEVAGFWQGLWQTARLKSAVSTTWTGVTKR